MRRHVEWFIRRCPECQKLSQVKAKNNAPQFAEFFYWPMDRLSMDFEGPHPPKGGYILVVIDTFTHWVELFHTTAATAEATVPCLLQIVGRYGAPRQIVSDRGSHFVNEAVKHLLQSNS